MKQNTLFLFFFFLANLALGQTRLAGRIVDAQGKGVAHAIVKVYKAEKEELVAFTKGNEEGEYVLLVSTDVGEKVRMRVNAFGYKSQTLELPNRSGRKDITLTDTPTGLREVTVRAPAVRSHGDTLSYSVANLSSRTDRNMEDVIRRIPGVSVEASGAIKYNGESINRFYIEGLDMLDGRYSLVTRNVRPSDVASVEVYENHQPISMLRGVEHSSRAALNLKLKKSRLSRPVGYLLLGGGWGERALWTAEAFGLTVGKNSQSLLTLKTNDCGENYSSETQTFYDEQTESENSLAANAFPDRPFGSPSVPENRYLNNRSAMASASHLTKLREGLTLTANADYTLADNDYRLASQTIYTAGTQGETVSAVDDNRTDLTLHKARLSAHWERNDSLRYLTDRLSLQGSWKRNGYAFSANGVNQRNVQDEWGIRNGLNWKMRAGRRVLSFSSKVQLAFSPRNTMAAIWSNTSEADEESADTRYMRQAVEGLSFRSAHSTSLSWGLGKHNRGGRLGLSMALGADFHSMDFSFKQKAFANAEATQGKPLAAAQANAYRIQTVVGPQYEVSIPHLAIRLAVPVRQFDIRYTDHALQQRVEHHRPHVSPECEATWFIKRNLRFLFNASYAERLAELDEWLSEPVYTSYRSLSTTGCGTLQQTNTAQASGQLFWTNHIKGRALTASGGYSRNEYNLASASYVNADGSTVNTSADGTTLTHTWYGQARLSRSIYACHAYLLMQYGINSSRSPLHRQGMELSVRSLSQQLSASAEQHYFDRRLSLTLIAGWQSMNVSSKGIAAMDYLLTDYKAELRISSQPINALSLSLSGQFRYTETTHQGGVKQFYLDGGATWNVSKRVELSLKASNLTNARTYLTRSFSSTDVTTCRYALRPTEAVMTCRWNF